MGLPESPPLRRTPAENHATLLISWWCTICALVIVLFRVFGRLARVGSLLSEDKYMCWAVIPLFIRMGLIHVVLLYGTNNTTIPGLTEEGIYHRSIGARLVLAARIFYAMYIWICKLTVSEFLKRLTMTTWDGRSEVVLKAIRGFLMVTFIGVIIGTLSECSPFDHYWQVVPDPGKDCRSGYAQLLTMGISDMITDIVLIVFPAFVIFRSNMPLKRKISTTLLYSLSAFLIVIAAYRMTAIIAVHGRQQMRSLWASLEILASAGATNAVILGSYVRDKGVKRQKFRSTYATESAGAPSFNRQLTRQHWGNDSDEDLFRSVARGRMGSLATEAQSSPMEAASPIAVFTKSPFHPKYADEENVEIYLDEITEEIYGHSGTRHDSERLDISDAGGLLGADMGSSNSEQTFRSPTDSVVMDFATVPQRSDGRSGRELDVLRPRPSPQQRRSSSMANFLTVITPGRSSSNPPPLINRPAEPGVNDMEIHDPGGLLS